MEGIDGWKEQMGGMNGWSGRNRWVEGTDGWKEWSRDRKSPRSVLKLVPLGVTCFWSANCVMECSL